MPFISQKAPRIWNTLRNVLIPDQLTMNPEYIRRFGVHITGNKKIDASRINEFVMVKIPIIKILEYFLEGLEVQIPKREDMLSIHEDIEAYLNEWKDYMRESIHGNIGAENNKELILSLEKLSQHIYAKAKPKEIIKPLRTRAQLGLINPFERSQEENKPIDKPDYDGIRNLITKKPTTRY